MGRQGPRGVALPGMHPAPRAAAAALLLVLLADVPGRAQDGAPGDAAAEAERLRARQLEQVRRAADRVHDPFRAQAPDGSAPAPPAPTAAPTSPAGRTSSPAAGGWSLGGAVIAVAVVGALAAAAYAVRRAAGPRRD